MNTTTEEKEQEAKRLLREATEKYLELSVKYVGELVLVEQPRPTMLNFMVVQSVFRNNSLETIHRAATSDYDSLLDYLFATAALPQNASPDEAWSRVLNLAQDAHMEMFSKPALICQYIGLGTGGYYISLSRIKLTTPEECIKVFEHAVKCAFDAYKTLQEDHEQERD